MVKCEFIFASIIILQSIIISSIIVEKFKNGAEVPFMVNSF